MPIPAHFLKGGVLTQARAQQSEGREQHDEIGDNVVGGTKSTLEMAEKHSSAVLNEREESGQSQSRLSRGMSDVGF